MKQTIKPTGECYVLTGRGMNQEDSHFRGKFHSLEAAEKHWKENAQNNNHPLQFAQIHYCPATIEKTLYDIGHKNVHKEYKYIERCWRQTGALISEHEGKMYRTEEDGTIEEM